MEIPDVKYDLSDAKKKTQFLVLKHGSIQNDMSRKIDLVEVSKRYSDRVVGQSLEMRWGDSIVRPLSNTFPYFLGWLISITIAQKAMTIRSMGELPLKKWAVRVV